MRGNRQFSAIFNPQGAFFLVARVAFSPLFSALGQHFGEALASLALPNGDTVHSRVCADGYG